MNDKLCETLIEEIRRLTAALHAIVLADQRTSGTNSEDHWQEDGPMAAIARKALIGR